MPRRRPEERTRGERLSAGAILLLGRRARRSLDRDVSEAVDVAVAHSPRASTRGGSLAVVLAASSLLAARAAASISSARRDSRAAAIARVYAELRAVGAGVPREALGTGAERAWEDEAHALAAAQSLAAQWQGAALAASMRALRTGEPASRALEGTKRAMASRAARTAETEVARAFNEERRLAVGDAAARDERVAREVRKLYRRWSALLDACEACADHDGEVVGLSEGFRFGEEPGFVHPRCRCSDEVVEG